MFETMLRLVSPRWRAVVGGPVTRRTSRTTTRGFASGGLAPLDASLVTVERRAVAGAPPAKAALLGNFGKLFSDHMLVADWERKRGWAAPRIVPYGDLSLSPAAMCLHYGLQCFEGMKAYKGLDGRIRLFRPDLNMARLNGSLNRLAMAPFDGAEFIALLKVLLATDANWVPDGEGYSMYLRPTAIADDPYLGVGEPQRTKLYCIMSPVGPYYPQGFKPIKVYADAVNVRAWPGGVGNAKVGGNYGPTIKPQLVAARTTGSAQVLYLAGPEKRVTEVGSMNVFVLWRRAGDKAMELITAPLDYGDILPGVTRRSVLELSRQFGDCTVTERAFTMDEVAEAAAEKRLLEVFGTGTAAVICPVNAIHHDGQDIPVPSGANDAGPFAKRLWNSLSDIHYGKVQHEWAVPIDDA